MTDMGVFSMTKNKDRYHVDAVFKIGFFKDDVTIKIEETQNKNDAVLHIRSASRKGNYDFGVTRWRVNRFMHRLAQKLSLHSAAEQRNEDNTKDN